MDDLCLTSVENIELEDKELFFAVENYNRSLPQGKHYLKLAFSNGLLEGTFKIFFQFRNPVNLTSIVRVGEVGGTERLKTQFRFQTQSTEYIPISNKSSVKDIIQFVRDQFKIQDPIHQFSLYEKFSDYGNANEYYRKFYETENPLNTLLRWSYRNQMKRIRLEIYDYDPNLGDCFENKTMEELNYILKTLDNEEKVATAAIKEKYVKLKEIYSQYCELSRPPEQEPRNPNVPANRSASQKKKKKKKKKF